MGAFDTISDDDPRAIAHNESKVRAHYGGNGRTINEYTDAELQAEIERREVSRIEQQIKTLSKRLEDLKEKRSKYGK